MSTTMVGDEPELESVTVEASGSEKEIKKVRLINSFFQPIQKRQDDKSKLDSSVNSVEGFDDAIHVKDCAGGLNACHSTGECSSNRYGKLPNKKTHNLFEEEKALTPGNRKKSSQKELAASAAQSSLKYLISSGSDFEEDGNTVLATKSRKGHKAVKKEKKIRSKRTRAIGHFKGKIRESNVDKESKNAWKARKSSKNKEHVHVCDCSQSSHEEHVDCVDIESKESNHVGAAQTPATSNSSEVVCHEDSFELNLGRQCSLSSETTKEERTSAFDILMKSQRVQQLQKLDPSLPESAAALSSENTSDMSCSCEVVTAVENLQSKTEITCQSESLLSAQFPSDITRTAAFSGTNAFDLLMKKGKLSKSCCNVDYQEESGFESELVDNDFSLSQKEHKKKSFEFQLSIRASKKSNFQFSVDSENCYMTGDGCEVEQTAVKRLKKQRRKEKKTNIVLPQGVSDESISEGKTQVKVSKSKRGKGKSKVKSSAKMKEDTLDISLIELDLEEKKDGKDKGRRKSKRKRSASTCNKVAGDIDFNEALDDKDFQTPAKSGRRNGKQQKILDDVKHIAEVQGKNARKKMKRKKTSDSDFVARQPTSTESQQIYVCISKDIQDGRKSEVKTEPNLKWPVFDSVGTGVNQVKNSDKKRAVAVKEDTNKEPKAVAATLLKRRMMPPNPDATEESSRTADSSASLSVCPVDNPSSITSEQNPSDIKLSQLEEKTSEEKEAARKAFKALFTGAGSQKALPAANITESLPAPWPVVSHVLQRGEDDSLGVNFWCLPWPAEKGHRLDIPKHCSLDGGNVFDSITATSAQEKAMFCGRKDLRCSQKSDMKTTRHRFPEAVIKKLLSELALFYPGVPLRKLYKRYSAKLEKHKALSTEEEGTKLVPGKNTQEKNMMELGEKKDHETENKPLPVKRAREKRKLSSDDGICQEKMFARKIGDCCVTLPSEGKSVLSAKKSCKKRGREDDSEEAEEVMKGRRLSTRLQKKKASVESDSVKDILPTEPVISAHKKKRRKTTDSQEDSAETPELSQEQDRDPGGTVVSNNARSMVADYVSDALWTDLYRPVLSSEVMANASAVSKLRSWLEEWKIKREKTLRKELQQQKRLLAKQKGKTPSSQGSSQSVEWWDADSDSDFQLSDDASDNSDSEERGLSTAMFITGPPGVGKTAIVYACAEELGYKVFEVNSSSKRSGKQILSQLEEATQSHLVINTTLTTSKGPDPGSSFMGVLKNSTVNSPCASGPLSAFFQPSGNASQRKDKAIGKEGKGKRVKEKKESSVEKGKSILKKPSEAVSNNGAESNLFSKAASLILFEEVDVIFEEDKSFWVAVSSFMQNAKCPIVLISTESRLSCEGTFEQLTLKAPSVNLLSAHLQLVGLMNNMFINPEDLQSLVARNNCDIRKCLLNLQFWVGSGGGIETPYKRPPGLTDKNNTKNESGNSKQQSAGHGSNTGCLTTNIAPSQEIQVEPSTLIGGLTDGGEESMFLSLSDWQAIRSGSLRPRSRLSRRGSRRQAEADNSDSDFCEPNKTMLMCADGSTDSIFEITDSNDSQQVSSNNDRESDPEYSLQLPVMDGLLVESVHGLLNCASKPAMGALSVLGKEEKQGYPGEGITISDKFHLAHFSQGLGVNLTYTNLSTLMPLFADSTATQSSEKLQTKLHQAQSSGTVPLIVPDLEKSESRNIFSDTSLFDDGTEQTSSEMDFVEGSEPAKWRAKDFLELNDTIRPSFQDSTVTGFSESQVNGETSNNRPVQDHEDNLEVSCDQPGNKLVRQKPSSEGIYAFKALEIFEEFAENMSLADAFCPNLSGAQPSSARFGWWGASLKPGLTDEHTTFQESFDWLTRDTRAGIRGALEVANLECCRDKVKCLSQGLAAMEFSKQNQASEVRTSHVAHNALWDFKVLAEHLPPRASNTVVRLDAVSDEEKSVEASRRKLYISLGGCIPTLYYCNHRCVTCDYIPTFRSLCHSEKLREEAHLRRRFLHYLDSNSFPVSRSTRDGLADSFLGL